MGVRERQSLVKIEKVLTGLREMKERGQGQTNAAELGEGRGGEARRELQSAFTV